MNLLIVAATEGEIAPLIKHLQKTSSSPSEKPGNVSTLITGVGMTATTYAVVKAIQAAKYDLIIQAGVAGAYDRSIGIGDVVFITSEEYGDLGAEDHDMYIDVFEMGLLQRNEFPYTNEMLVNPPGQIHDNIKLRQVMGVTVNTVSGSDRTIQIRSERYGSQVESMEGAAFHYVCLQEKVPFAQIRSISNYVVPRDKSQWKMKDAVINLNEWLINFIEQLPTVRP